MLDTIYLVLLIPSLSIILRNQAQTLIKPRRNLPKILLDAVIYSVPLVYGLTLGASDLGRTTSVIASFTIILMLLNHFSKRNRLPNCESFKKSSGKYFRSSFEGNTFPITSYRAFTLISSCIAILACDFNSNVFPERFTKSRDYGFGYMDIGIGAFVISNAIVCPDARGKTRIMTMNDKLKIALKVTKQSLPILVLGIFRSIVIGQPRGAGEWEYGRHWNFFITLFCVRVLGSYILCCTNNKTRLLTGMLILFGYEIILKLGVETWINRYYSRRNLLLGSREGIFSTMGHLGTYIIGAEIGRLLYQSPGGHRSRLGALQKLLALVVGSFVIGSLLHYFDQRPSRRMGNLPFTNMMIFVNVSGLITLILADYVVDLLKPEEEKFALPIGKSTEISVTSDDHREESSTMDNHKFNLLSAANYNGLVFFLLANLTTGCVNKIIMMQRVTPVKGFIILNFYITILNIIFSYLYMNKISIVKNLADAWGTISRGENDSDDAKQNGGLFDYFKNFWRREKHKNVYTLNSSPERSLPSTSGKETAKTL